MKNPSIMESLSKAINIKRRVKTEFTSKGVNFVHPIEILDSNEGKKHQFLYISTQKGYVIIDMNKEQIKVSEIDSRAVFTKMVVISGSYTDNVNIVGSNGNKIYSWMISIKNGTVDVTFQAEGTLNGEIIDLIGYYDVPSTARWVAVLLKDAQAPSSIQFYKFGDSPKPFEYPIITWKLSLQEGTKTVRLGHQRFISYDKNAFPTSPKCFTADEDRTLIVVHTESMIFVFGFTETVIGEHAIELKYNSAIGKNLYYIAPEGTEITSVGSWGECMGSLSTLSQKLWLAVSLKKGIEYTLDLIELPEFAEVDLKTCVNEALENWWLMPSDIGRTDENGDCIEQPFNPCNGTPEYYLYRDPETQTLLCKKRNIISHKLSGPVKQIQIRVRTDNKEDTKASDIYYAYVTHIFALSNTYLDIISFQEKACSSETPISNKLSSISYSTWTSNFEVSANGLHVFTVLMRPEWEVESQKRLVEICNEIAKNPNSEHLSKFVKICAEQSPSDYNIYDFLRYHSSCNGGFLCPLFGHSAVGAWTGTEIKRVEPGNHIIRPMKEYKCEPEFFCPAQTDSMRVPCPPGFKCPYEGLKAPIPCEVGSKFEKACLAPRLTHEAPCPSGSLCFTPSTATPTPPGYYVQTESRTYLYLCKPGYFCPLQTGNDTNHAILCPPGYYCKDPKALKPVPCTSTFDSNKSNNYTQFCPIGTASGDLCPAGYECNNVTSIKKCEDGYFCPAGTQYAQPCPAGKYCPDPSQIFNCPKGYYCRAGTTNPVKCQYLVYCPMNTTKESYALGALLIDAVLAVVLIIGFYSIRICLKSYRKKQLRQKMANINAIQRESGLVLESMSTPILSDMDDEQDGGLPKKKFTMDIEFEDIRLRRKKTKQTLIEGASGKFPAGKISCVLTAQKEASNALLDILAGRSDYGYLDGVIKINGIPEPEMSSFSQIIGLVEKNDIIDPNIRIREAIRFAGHARLPYMTTFSQIGRKIDVILEILGLTELQYKAIGKPDDELGLSLVQRKLVAIGQEMIAEPSLLLLDNPFLYTNYTESIHVMNVLRQIAATGCTVVCFVDQPRWELFNAFDHCVIIGKAAVDEEILGEKKMASTVYNGPAKSALQYFEELGFKCPVHVNPADYFLEILNGNVERPGDNQFTCDKMTHFWKLKEKEAGKPWTNVEKLRKDSVITSEHHIIELSNASEKKRKRMGFFGQYFLFSARSLLQLLRHGKGLLFDLAFILLATSILGGLYFNMEFIGPISPNLQELCPIFVKDQCSLPRSDKVAPIALLTGISIAICAVHASQKVFGQDMNIFKREARFGINKLSYFLGKMTAHTPATIIYPFFFLSVWYTFIAPKTYFFYYYGIFLCIYWMWTGFGYLMSITLSRVHASFFSVLFILMSAMLSGYSPTLVTLYEYWYAAVLVSLSPMRWSQEVLYVTELESYRRDGTDIDMALRQYNFKVEHIWMDIAILLVFGIVFRLLAFIVLYFKDPKMEANLKMYLRIIQRRIKRYAMKIMGRKGKKKVKDTLKKGLLEEQGNELDEYHEDQSEPILQEM